MSSANAAEQRSPDAAATSPGYQGSDGASSTQQTAAERPSAEKEGQAAPSSEPAKAKEGTEPSTAAPAAEPASGNVDAGAAKPGEEDATPAKEVMEGVVLLQNSFVSKKKNRVVFLVHLFQNIGDLDNPPCSRLLCT